MPNSSKEQEIIKLEEQFWKSIVDKDTQIALDMLHEPALMVSSKGAMKFDHAGYRKMAEDDSYKLVDFKITHPEVVFPSADVAVMTYQVNQKTEMKGKKMETNMSDSSTWVKKGKSWVCVIHTECPVAEESR